MYKIHNTHGIGIASERAASSQVLSINCLLPSLSPAVTALKGPLPLLSNRVKRRISKMSGSLQPTQRQRYHQRQHQHQRQRCPQMM